ncbi:hypothetical protein [Nocardioides sp.]|uniref:hypothetical protein n=1 Tax=Nocardioides sp. TaxID=35761 RepID=UPI0037847010
MSEAFILEFRGVGAEAYHRVNEILGVDMTAGTGLPPGLAAHTGAATADGLLVLEVWDSREAAGEFLSSRLGAALAEAGVPEPSRREWMSLEGSFVR